METKHKGFSVKEHEFIAEKFSRIEDIISEIAEIIFLRYNKSSVVGKELSKIYFTPNFLSNLRSALDNEWFSETEDLKSPYYNHISSRIGE